MVQRSAKVKEGARGLGFGVSKKTSSKPQTPNPKPLLAWYDQHRRILPWRAPHGQKPDPYHVWLSEIMLQQTTVGAVGPYYQKFLKRWPTLDKLARARREDILRMWAGLGYYRRAHLLHECAKQIMRDYGGEFPQFEAELRRLPGFGAYTAAAVAAIAFDRRANVVDGNVERVMSRLFAIRTPLPAAKTELRAAAEKLLPQARFGDYAQALMDLGATICTPRNPKCDLCPWNKSCRAHELGIENQLPRRVAARTKPVRLAIAFFVMDEKGRVLIRRRAKQGLLGGMMEIPSSAWCEGAMPELTAVRKEAPIKASWRLIKGQVRHVFTHFELGIAVAVGEIDRAANVKNGKWIALERLHAEALPSVMRKIIKHAIKGTSSRTIFFSAAKQAKEN